MEKNLDPEELIKKAHKCIEPGFFKAVFSNVNDRLEKAAGYYNEAGEIYKLKKEWIKAGDCFMEVVKINEGLKEDVLDAYDNAILCYKKGDAKEKYEKILNKLIKMFEKDGKFSKAAELNFEMTQKLIESNKNTKDEKIIEEILNSFDQCLDYYEMEKDANKNDVNKVQEAKADFICMNDIKDELDRAKFIYEEIAKSYLTNNYVSFNAKEYYGKNVLLYLAFDDLVTAKAFLHRYYNDDPSFKGSNLGKFLETLLLIFENKGADITDKDIIGDSKPINLESAINTYKDKIKNNPKLWDDWKDHIIGVIKEKLDQLFKETGDVYEEDFK